MRIYRVVLLLFLLGVLGQACSFLVFDRDMGSKTPTLRCTVPPETFEVTDLIGTWVAEYNERTTDTLIVRQDGKYKQIFNASYNSFESDWQDWWIERRESGFIRLHLKGMRRCDSIDSLCNKEGGGLEKNMWTIDECEADSVEMTGEVILIVTGLTDGNYHGPRNILLRHARLAGTEWYYTFHLQEEP